MKMAPPYSYVMARARLYKARHPAGGPLHLVLDDGNVDDRSVRHCVQSAREAGDEEGAQLAELVLRMSKEQRRRLVEFGVYAGAPRDG